MAALDLTARSECSRLAGAPCRRSRTFVALADDPVRPPAAPSCASFSARLSSLVFSGGTSYVPMGSSPRGRLGGWTVRWVIYALVCGAANSPVASFYPKRMAAARGCGPSREAGGGGRWGAVPREEKLQTVRFILSPLDFQGSSLVLRD